MKTEFPQSEKFPRSGMHTMYFVNLPITESPR